METTSFFGEILIDSVKNIFENESENNDCKLLTNDHVKFVHYPDCQQLSIWLPDYYSKFSTISIIDFNSKESIFDSKVSDIIQGSIKIVIDSLFISPGRFLILIHANCGLTHQIYFTKLHEGEKIIQPKPLQTEVEQDLDKPPLVYRDGFGNIIENEDLNLRSMLSFNTLRKVFRHLEFKSQGREGEVIYHDAMKQIRFYMEFGGNDVVFYLNIPRASEWKTATGFPLHERDDILRFVAEGTQKAQAPSCFYQITEGEILFKKR